MAMAARGGLAGVDDHGDFGDAFAEERRLAVLVCRCRSRWARLRHYGGSACVDDFAGGDKVVVV